MQKLTAGKWLRVCLLFFAVTLPLFLSGCLGAGNVTLASGDISGTWSMAVTPTGGSAQTADVKITQTANSTTISVTGTILGQTVTDAQGTNDGQKVTFTGTVGTTTNTFDGTINTEGTTMSGTYTQSGNSAGSWTATKTSADFTISCTPTAVTPTITSTCTLIAVSGFSSTVGLTCDPAAPTTGGSCSFDPQSLTPTAAGVTSRLTYICAAAGTASFSVVGTSGTLTHNIAMTVTCP